MGFSIYAPSCGLSNSFYGFCPKCSAPLIYNRYNHMIECSAQGCHFSREYTQEDDDKVTEVLSQDFQRNQKFDEMYKANIITDPEEYHI